MFISSYIEIGSAVKAWSNHKHTHKLIILVGLVGRIGHDWIYRKHFTVHHKDKTNNAFAKMMYKQKQP